jgi:hypothetical protein
VGRGWVGLRVGGPKPRVEILKKNYFGNSDLCKREYRPYRTWVEAGKWGVGMKPIGVGRLG